MTENNPFGNLDLGAMLEQAQAMQAQLVQAQQELAESSVEGTAGGVSVTVDGTGELTGVTIPPHTVDTGDEEAWTDLGDLVVAAYRDRYQISDDTPLGPAPQGSAQKIDRARAHAAFNRAQKLAEAEQPEQERARRSESQRLGPTL